MFVRLLVTALIALVAWAALVRPSEGAGPERAYVVRPADTLWSIAAAHYGGDPRAAVLELQRRNRLTGTLLRPGQRLVLP
ncbi:MAG: LysM peptidoglycan-binding domain-containing protein [Actinobacteria bacterium]|nr:LysM peptidoglycan-binding domain-containing protein [Actinomycetota bacterium]